MTDARYSRLDWALAGGERYIPENAPRTFIGLIARCIWPSGLLSKLGVVWSAWSILNLLGHALDVGFGPTLQVALDYFDRALSGLLRPLESLISPLLAPLSEAFGLQFVLEPHWKYLFVLIGLYVFRSAAVVWGRGERISATFRFVVGACAALSASAIAGSIPANSEDRYGAFLIVAIPLAGVFFYNVLNSIWDGLLMRPVPNRLRVVSAMSYFERRARSVDLNYVSHALWNLIDHLVDVAKRCALAISFVIGVLFIPGVLALPSPGVLILAALVCVVAIWNIIHGAVCATGLVNSRIVDEGVSWVQVFSTTSSGRLGTSMFAVVFWTVVFVVSNAGLGLVGL